MSEYGSKMGQGSPAFDDSMGKVLVSLGRETFETLYDATHSEAAEVMYQIRQDAGQENAPLPDYIKREFDQKNQEYEQQWDSFSPGEFMILYGPLHSPEAEKLYQTYNRDALVGANDPSINDYATERLQAMINDVDIYDEDAGLSDEEKKQRRLLKQASEAFEDIERTEEKRRLAEWQKRWDEDMHRIGNHEYSGAQLHSMWEYLQDQKQAEAFDQVLAEKYGISKEEAKKRRLNLQDYLNLQEKERNGEELTEQEKYDLAHPSEQVAQDTKILQERVNEGRVINVTKEVSDRYASADVQISTDQRARDFADNSQSGTQTGKSLFSSTKESITASPRSLTAVYAQSAENEQAATPPPVIEQPKTIAMTMQVSGFGL